MGYDIPLRSEEECALDALFCSGKGGVLVVLASMSWLPREISNSGSGEGLEPVCAFMRLSCILY